MQNFDTVMSTLPAATTTTTTTVGSQQQPEQHHQSSSTSSPSGWFDLTIKSEPLDYHSHQLHHSHHHHHQLQQRHQQDTPLSNGHGHDHSSPTSPQSVDSMDSLSGKSGFFEAKVATGLMSGGYNPLGFNPLTPPGYSPGLLGPASQQQQHQQHQQQQQQHHHQQQGLPGQSTRLSTPNRSYGKGSESVYAANAALTPTHTPPMDVTPPKSPKESAETPVKEGGGGGGGGGGEEQAGSDCEDVSYDGSEDEEGIRKPKVNSHGQVKKFRCKQCDFVAVTKLNFWEHTRSHIKPEKMLTCPKCPFVTEYKHHLEYHLRNHQRSKPFQCPKCSYSCVNKSMLNSHMKSHSNVFQYRCADCNYATKYCHSLKLHLRKYGHKPDVVLNLDGTPNPLPIIDVYGTRRGPKAKPPKTAEQKMLLKQEQAEAKAQLQHQQQQQQQQQQQLQQLQQLQNIDQAPLTPQHHSGAAAGQPPFTPPSGQAPNGLMRNLFPHQLFPNPLAHMFKSAAANGNLPLFPYLNLNFQMFADQQANMVGQLSPTHFQQTLMSQLGADKAGLLNNNNSHNNNNSQFQHHHQHSNGSGGQLSGSEDNDLSVKTSASSASLGEELLKQITAAAADSSGTSGTMKGGTVSGGGGFDRSPEPSEPETNSTGEDCPVAMFEDSYPAASAHPQTPSTSGKVERSRRKGRAFKLAQLSALTSAGSTDMETQYGAEGDGDDGEQQQQQQQVESKEAPPAGKRTASGQAASEQQRSLECKYCDIAFRDDVLYTIHMGYHGYDDVFKCNMCGEKSEDRIGFFLHIARKAH